MSLFKVIALLLLLSRINLSVSHDNDSSLAWRYYASGWSVLGKRKKKHRREPARHWNIVFTKGFENCSSDMLAPTAWSYSSYRVNRVNNPAGLISSDDLEPGDCKGSCSGWDHWLCSQALKQEWIDLERPQTMNYRVEELCHAPKNNPLHRKQSISRSMLSWPSIETHKDVGCIIILSENIIRNIEPDAKTRF